MGQVEFGGFKILWLKPNPTYYKKKKKYIYIYIVTQPNPPSPKNWLNPTGQFWRVDGLAAYL